MTKLSMARSGWLLIALLLAVVLGSVVNLNLMQTLPAIEAPFAPMARWPGQLSSDDCRHPTTGRVRFAMRPDVRAARDGVLRTIVEALPEPPPASAVVERSWIPLPPRGQFELEMFASAPRALREVVRDGAFDCPSGAWPREWDSILVRREDARWAIAYRERFRRAFPGTRGLLRLSSPEFSQDLLDGIVYYDYICFVACGHGAHVWLHRDARDSPWRIQATGYVWQN